MNNATLSGQWNELKGKVKQQWSKLTDDDLGLIQGNADELIGRLQQAYGYSKERALTEFDQFKKRFMSGAPSATGSSSMDSSPNNKEYNDKSQQH